MKKYYTIVFLIILVFFNLNVINANDNTNPACNYESVWAIDLWTDTTHGSAWIYSPWIYCINWAVTQTTNVILDWNWYYEFRWSWDISVSAWRGFILHNGASYCDVHVNWLSMSLWAGSETWWFYEIIWAVAIWANTTIDWQLSYWTITVWAGVYVNPLICPQKIYWCMDSQAVNFMPTADTDNETCEYIVYEFMSIDELENVYQVELMIMLLITLIVLLIKLTNPNFKINKNTLWKK